MFPSIFKIKEIFLSKISILFYFLISFFSSLNLASAHEVYVLGMDMRLDDIAADSPNPFLAIAHNQNLFFFWGFLCVLLVIMVLIFSLTKKFEKIFDPYLFKMKNYAALIARVTLGTCLIASAYNMAVFGPELPFSNFVGEYTEVLSIFLFILGLYITIGVLVRICSLLVILFYIYSFCEQGVYMLTYVNYLGLAIFSLIIGSGICSVNINCKNLKNLYWENILSKYEKYSFLILRIFFGVGIIYATYYAKFLHSKLAVDTVIEYNLTNYFHFTPLFIVLGAFIIEFIVGLFFIIGFEIRFTAIVFLTFLALSLCYFGEAFWPHFILIGINLSLFAHGYDKYTIEKKLFKQRSNLEPIL